MSQAWGKYEASKGHELYLGVNWGDIQHAITSSHESGHRGLDISTPYGAVLNSYSTMSRVSDDQEIQEVVEFLNKGEKLVQEVWATWASLSTFRDSIGDKENEGLINPEYLDYFNYGQRIVEKIPGHFIKMQVLLTVCCSCLYSRAYGEIAKQSFPKFRFSELRNLDYPEKRFLKILDCFTSEQLSKEVEVLFRDKADDIRKHYEQDKLDGLLVDSVDVSVLTSLSTIIVGHFFPLFTDFFAGLGSHSYALESHVHLGQYLNNQVLRLNNLPTSDSVNYLDDPETLRLRISEEEKIIFRHIPISARLVKGEPGSVAFNAGEELLLLAQPRHSLITNFSFSQDDEAWLLNGDTPVVYFKHYCEDSLSVVIFETFEILSNCLSRSRHLLSIFLSTYFSCWANQDFRQNWLPQLAELIEGDVIILDISPLTCIAEDFLLDVACVSFCQFEMSSRDSEFLAAGVFIVEHIEGFKWIFIAPGSDSHIESLTRYINVRCGNINIGSMTEFLNPLEQSLAAKTIINIHETYSFEYLIPNI